ncbi:MAG TPA: ornithine cyclodeaminase family protein [Chloroflexota bacterium]
MLSPESWVLRNRTQHAGLGTVVVEVKMTLVLREGDVKSLMDMGDAVKWVEDGLRALGEGKARNVPRQRVKMPKGTLHVLPGADFEQGVVGLKCYTTFREGTRFLVTLFSSESGKLLSLMEADYLGMMRTGAASGVATKYMALSDADVLALFGTGWQARGQLLAIAAAKPIKRVQVYGRDAARRGKFADELSKLAGVEVVPVDSVAAALDGAKIVTTVTSARQPLFASDAVQPGTHINAVGSNGLLRQELDEELVRRASIVAVDSRQQSKVESGDLLIPTERGWIDWDQLPELGEIVAGRQPGRRDASDITIFESHGLGLEDVTVAARVYQRAKERGIGQEIELLP